MTKRTARKASPAASTSSVALATIKPTITFVHSDGSFAEASPRSVRIVAAGPDKGTLVVERRKKLFGIAVTGPRAAQVNLGDTPVLSGYEEAQAVAPCATLAALGIAGTPKPTTTAPKAATKAAAKSTASVPAKGPGRYAKVGAKASPSNEAVKQSTDAAIKALAASLEGATPKELEMAFLSIAGLVASPK